MKLTFVPPMLAELHDVVPRGDQWLYEVKLDGYRIEALKEGASVRLISRKGNDLTRNYPAIVRAVHTLRARSAIVDGELVAIDSQGRPSFQALQNRSAADLSLVYYAFDLLHRDGRDLRTLTLVERKRQLAEVADGSTVQLSIELEGSVDDISRAVKSLGLEGIIAKRRSSRYSPGRHGHWVKVKFLNRQEFVVGGYKPGLGTFESLIVGYYEDGALRFAGKVRNGLTPLLRRQLWPKLASLASTAYPFIDAPVRTKSRWGEGLTSEDMQILRWLEPRLVAEVGFVEWTNEAHLRHPTFLGLREDKNPKEVLREAPAAKRVRPVNRRR